MCFWSLNFDLSLEMVSGWILVTVWFSPYIFKIIVFNFYFWTALKITNDLQHVI